MIKNASASLAWLAAFALLSGCNAARAKQEAPLQGVIEHDDRVIGFELPGRVLEVSVERGAKIAEGAKLAKLDDGLELPQRDLRKADVATADAQLRLLQAGARREDLSAAEAEVAAIAAQEQETSAQLKRESALYAAGAAPQSKVDDLTAQLKALGERRRALEQRHKALRAGARSDELAAAQARADAARASLALVEARIARYALVSPAAGSIVDVHVKEGEMVAAGTPAITLADLDHPYVDVFVPEGRMQGIAVGARTEVRVDGVAQALKGVVEHVFPRTEFTPRYLFSEGERPNLVIRTRVRIEDPKHVLHEGVPAFVRLVKS